MCDLPSLLTKISAIVLPILQTNPGTCSCRRLCLMMWQSAGRLIGWEIWLVFAWLSIILDLFCHCKRKISKPSIAMFCWYLRNLAIVIELKEGQQGINSFALLIIKESCYGHEVSYGKCWLFNCAIVKPPIRLFMLT